MRIYLGIDFGCCCCSCDGWWWIRTTCLRKEIRRLFPIRQCARRYWIRIRLQPRKSFPLHFSLRTVKGQPFPHQGNYLTFIFGCILIKIKIFCLHRSSGLTLTMVTVNTTGNTITVITLPLTLHLPLMLLPLTPSLPRLTNKPRPNSNIKINSFRLLSTTIATHWTNKLEIDFLMFPFWNVGVLFPLAMTLSAGQVWHLLNPHPLKKRIIKVYYISNCSQFICPLFIFDFLRLCSKKTTHSARSLICVHNLAWSGFPL